MNASTSLEHFNQRWYLQFLTAPRLCFLRASGLQKPSCRWCMSSAIFVDASTGPYSASRPTCVAFHHSFSGPSVHPHSSVMIAQAAKGYATAIEDLTTILGYLSPYFPFTAGGSVVARRDIKVSVLAGRGGPREHRLVRYLITQPPFLGRANIPGTEPDLLRADLLPRPRRPPSPGIHPTRKCRQKTAAESTAHLRSGTGSPGRASERVRRATTPRGDVYGECLGTARRPRGVLGAPAHHMVAAQQRSRGQRGCG